MSEKLAVLVPPEPPEGSVFLDRLERAWQRHGPVWIMAAPSMLRLLQPGVRWGQLLLDCGDGEVIWQPTPQRSDERTAEAAAAAEQLAAQLQRGQHTEPRPDDGEPVPHPDWESCPVCNPQAGDQ